MSETNEKKPVTTNKLFAWQESKGGLIFIILFDLAMTYVFVMFALDTGSMIDYALAFGFFVLAIAQGSRLYKKVRSRE